MARQIRAFWLVLSWSEFRYTDRGHKLCIFLFSKAGRFKTNMARVSHIINYLLT